MTVLAVIYTILVVVDGAFFFFLMIGAIKIGSEDDTHWWTNWSIQVLCGLFTYPAIVNVPWVMSHSLHLCSKNSEAGHDFYGVPTDDIWFNVSVCKRSACLFLKFLNITCQWVNQWSRVAYPTYEDANTYPGNFYCNVFFGASFLSGVIAAVIQLKVEARLRRIFPGRFAAGPWEALQELRRTRSLGLFRSAELSLETVEPPDA